MNYKYAAVVYSFTRIGALVTLTGVVREERGFTDADACYERCREIERTEAVRADVIPYECVPKR